MSIVGIVKKVRTVIDGLRGRQTRSKSTGGRSRRNPWPRCESCHHRNPPEETCQACALCASCCDTCDQCGRCVMRCPGHDARQDDGQGEQQDSGKFTFSVEKA